MPEIAPTLLGVLSELAGGPLPIRLTAWDGSQSGPVDGVGVRLLSVDALRHLVWSPGELGLARAYVTGALDVEGDFGAGLARVLDAVGVSRGPDSRTRRAVVRMSPVALGRAMRALARAGVLGRDGMLGSRPPAPESEARPRGRLHSLRRDAEVISHHYDLSNDFYALLMDGSMAYSCGYWTSEDDTYSLADAQRDKLDLICRKLNLGPGRRLLDVGCGWGSLTVHAASAFGASVTAVTVSREQREHVAGRLAAEGVGHLVDLRLADYREVLAAAARHDAVAAVEMGEHVGEARYADFMAGLFGCLRPEGRLLLQVMSRGRRYPGGGPFIERYIAPDMSMRPLHATLGYVQGAGFEVRDVQALREHYVRTIRAWSAEMEARWDEVVGLIGAERARVWRLYLVGSAMSFADNRMGVDQVLAVRPAARGSSGMAPTRAGWEPVAMRV